MVDQVTKKRLLVRDVGTAGPYISVPVIQLEDVCRLLDSHGLNYSVDEWFVSLNGSPETAEINLGCGADANAAQAILDGIEVDEPRSPA